MTAPNYAEISEETRGLVKKSNTVHLHRRNVLKCLRRVGRKERRLHNMLTLVFHGRSRIEGFSQVFQFLYSVVQVNSQVLVWDRVLVMIH